MRNIMLGSRLFAVALCTYLCGRFLGDGLFVLSCYTVPIPHNPTGWLFHLGLLVGASHALAAVGGLALGIMLSRPRRSRPVRLLSSRRLTAA